MVLLVAGAQGWGLRQSALLLLPLVGLELLFHQLVQRRLPRLERSVMQALAQGGGLPQLLALIRGQRLLRFAAPRDRILGLLGLVHGHLGLHALAPDAYRDALEEAPPARSFPLAVGLGDSLFELGQLDEAEAIYREAMDDKHHSSRACANLARIIQRRGGDLREAEIYMRQALELSRDPALRQELAALLEALGREEEARWQRDLLSEASAGKARQGASAGAGGPRAPGPPAEPQP